MKLEAPCRVQAPHTRRLQSLLPPAPVSATASKQQGRDPWGTPSGVLLFGLKQLTDGVADYSTARGTAHKHSCEILSARIVSWFWSWFQTWKVQV